MPRLMEQVDNPDHSLFRPSSNATNESYAKQRGRWTMRAQSNAASAESDTVVQFAPAFESAGADVADQLDRAGQTILNMLHSAANLAEANSQHALDMAQKLSHQLRAAEARIAELEAEGQTYQERAERAEQWLHRVYSEIEDRFLKPGERRNAVTGAPRRNA
jgi:predicted ribosome quality control (RQC) complex YloA/Tae2 family protein